MGRSKGAKNEKTKNASKAIEGILSGDNPPAGPEELADRLNADSIPTLSMNEDVQWDAERVRKFCLKEQISLPFEIPQKRRRRVKAAGGETPRVDREDHTSTTEAPQPEASQPLCETTRPKDSPGESCEDTTPAPHPLFAYPMDPETISVLMEMVQWWKTRKDQDVLITTRAPQMTHRPNFPGMKTNSGIRVNTRLLKAALEKAKTPEEAKKLGGGGLSPLIERLFWQYLNYDQKFLEPGEC